jgi:hypothetical protein
MPWAISFFSIGEWQSISKHCPILIQGIERLANSNWRRAPGFQLVVVVDIRMVDIRGVDIRLVDIRVGDIRVVLDLAGTADIAPEDRPAGEGRLARMHTRTVAGRIQELRPVAIPVASPAGRAEAPALRRPRAVGFAPEAGGHQLQRLGRSSGK